MPLTASSPLQRSTRSLRPLLMALLPIGLGLFILHLQAERALQQSSLETAQEAVRQFDLMLDNSHIAAQALLPLAGQACDEQQQLALRDQVVRRPFCTLNQPGVAQEQLLQLAAGQCHGAA